MGNMYVKLSFRNVKRSFKDYTIYFLTLTFAVCIFYSFNSLEAQQVMLDFSNSQRATVEQLIELISGVSIFVSIILGFLILFANNFLIKRRKKELGMYLTLGMSKYGVSRILMMETLFIGVLSLIVGLLIGIVLSQGLSVFTAMLFDVNITKYEFVFSVEAMKKTILYFSVTFILVIIFNSIVMSRYTIMSLLTAGKKNEQVKIRKTSTSFFLFILSISSLAVAYIVIWKNGLTNTDIVWVCVGLGSFGTLLFFMSLSGFALKLLQQSERFYFKQLNMFVSRQINSKVNSTFVSMSIICLMLFFTLGVLSTSFSIKHALEKELSPFTPYDATINMPIIETPSIETVLMKVGMDIAEYEDYWVYTDYVTKETLNQIILPYIDKKKEFSKIHFDANPEIIKRSDYEQLMKLQQKKPISLKKNEVLLLLNAPYLEKVLQNYIKKNETIVINNKKYSISKSGIQKLTLVTGDYSSDLTVIVPDNDVKGLKAVSSIISIQYDGKKEHDEAINNLLTFSGQSDFYDKYKVNLYGKTKTEIYEREGGYRAMLAYIGIYLGLVFLMASATVLALQQLAEASDNLERYTILKKIGVGKQAIHKAIFMQIFIYFMMPLSLAIIHSLVGIPVASNDIIASGHGSILVPSLFAASIIIGIYGMYFVATYKSYKNIVK